jgi:hypothetical protein
MVESVPDARARHRPVAALVPLLELTVQGCAPADR